MADVTIGEELMAFRDRFPDCVVVAFADLSTGMVLAASTQEKTTQEKLDALCEDAFAHLVGSASRAVATELGLGDAPWPRSLVTATETCLTCLLHAHPPAREALCLILRDYETLDCVLRDAGQLLDRIAADA